jgi:hypothetical protein
VYPRHYDEPHHARSTTYRHLYLFTELSHNGGTQIVAVFDLLAVNRHDGISGSQTGASGWAARGYTGHGGQPLGYPPKTQRRI